jgi:hypothetical protein
MDSNLRLTRAAYLWTNLLNMPFWGIFNMLPFILYKDLQATPLQIAAIITLKPMVSLISVYWSALVNRRRERLLSNLIWARIIAHLPFFLFPFIDNVWFFIASFSFYMMLARGVMPAWMEIIKLNIPAGREKLFAMGSMFGYAGNAILPFAIGWMLDNYVQSWRWIFPFAACISLTATFFKSRITIRHSPEVVPSVPFSLKEQVIAPWKYAWDLLKRRPDFVRFQWGFMLGGAGIMIMQPALPEYFVDVLSLSYTEMAVALTLCKGIGFALTTPMWARAMHKLDIFKISAFPPICICFFAVCLMAAKVHIGWLYLAYIWYGIMQAGSEMSWHLSGLIFSKNEDSSTYSSVNVLTVGLRGCIIPPLGSCLLLVTAPTVVIFLGGLLCWGAYSRLSFYSRNAVEEEEAEAPSGTALAD